MPRRRVSLRALALLAGLTLSLAACETGVGTDHAGSRVTSAPTASRSAVPGTTTKPTDPADAPSKSAKPGKGSPSDGGASDPATTTGLIATSTRATAALDRLTVKGKAAMTGYDRLEYGPAWSDVDHNGCDTRNDVLDRDLTDKTYREGTHFCIVTGGRVVSPYTGETIDFVRGNVTSLEVQIDHVVALASSWVTGAQAWDADERKAFANDPLNLLAVDGASNGQKLASDASAWLPSRKAFRCTYVALQISVKAKYGLWVTKAEKSAMSRVLDSCPAQTTYRSHPVPTKATHGRTGESTPSRTSTSSSSGDGASTKETRKKETKTGTEEDPRFATCAEAKAEGYGPYADGVDPEYDWYRDADGDGTVCE